MDTNRPRPRPRPVPPPVAPKRGTLKRVATYLLLVAGLVMLALGLLFGFRGVTADRVDCGSAFRPSSDSQLVRSAIGVEVGPDGQSRIVTACDDARSGRRTLTYGLLIPGVVLAVVGSAVIAAAGDRSEDGDALPH